MTKEEKQLLLKDLCARLPYNTHLFTNSKRHIRLLTISRDLEYDKQYWINGLYDIDEVKPYLRPMSSMTDDEREEFNHLYYDIPVVRDCGNAYRDAKVLEWMHIDWYNKHHFDYRSLIPKGLALVAPEEMYKMEE